ncbi:MAG: type IV pilus modification protein PilV [Burkholderiales bacterium]
MHIMTMRKSNRAGQRARMQAGFSMIEVLISLVLIAVAMFGHAGLQLNAMKFAKSGASRTQAAFLSNELAERMEANKAGSVGGNYVVASESSTPSTAATDCLTAACNATALAAYDLAEWTTRVAATLPPGASWQITNPTAGNPSWYTIVVNWPDRRANTASTTYATAGATERLSLTSTKVVYQE